MPEKKCRMCRTENPTREVKSGDYTLQVCGVCKDKHEQDQVYQRIQPLVEALCKELNGGDKERIVKAFLAAFNREHRYLQGSFFQLLWLFFRDYAGQNKQHHVSPRRQLLHHLKRFMEEAKFFDGRNEHRQGMARKWYKAMD